MNRDEPRSFQDLLSRVRARAFDALRLRIGAEIGRGGMGSVREAWDEDFRRKLAIKILVPAGGGERDADSTAQVLSRFFDEAQITAQLDHPGVVPVHELGLDAEGRPYFTMRRVRGRDLARVFALAREEREGWNTTRAVGALLKVCETMAFAHEKGVIHRDLKPENVMTGDFGEVYVMDWGLARAIGRDEARRDASTRTIVRSDRRDSSDSSSQVLTLDGDVLGTPAYMPPEQARGELDVLDARADVYALGAMLYQLLANAPPYVPSGARLSATDVLKMVLEGPPRPIAEIAPRAPQELVAISEKAMARDPAQRYADMRALGDDLRAYLEGRVVQAYERGAIAGLRKWVARNRAVASAIAAGVLALAIGLVFALREKARADDNARTAQANARLAAVSAESARREKENVLRLSAFQELESLRGQVEILWPAEPERVDDFRAWLLRARSLVAGLDADAQSGTRGHRAQLAELRARGRQTAESEWAFDSDTDRWWHAQLSKLIAEIESFADEKTGLVRGVSADFGPGVERRLEAALALSERSVEGTAARAAWTRAIASIADERECPMYRGLSIVPQRGLLPIGRDPRSGLWEFAHVQSGEIAARDAQGKIVMNEGAGLVLVLVPALSFRMGAQKDDPTAPNFDAQARRDEQLVHVVALEPFFLSKFEMTQSQWLRAAGSNPSYFASGRKDGSVETGPTHPVEQVSWPMCARVLRRLELALPTEEQWEGSARAGTSSVWSSGNEATSLAGCANLCDATALKAGVPWRPVEEWLTDGFVAHAPVGSFEPNAFGFYDMHGNVWEWCADAMSSYRDAANSADAASKESSARDRCMRGGSFGDPAVFARCAARGQFEPTQTNYVLGVRPVRALVR